MNKKSILTMEYLSKDNIFQILEDAIEFSNDFKDWTLSQKRLVANLFFEPSTRTHYSFISAELQLGIEVANFNPENSSLTKGESLYDTVKTFEALGYDAVVIRHGEDRYFEQLENINIPILNGGDGKSNHPSQSLLDLYTIYDEFKKFNNINVLIVGDIKHSRVAHSNLHSLEKLGANVKFSGPIHLQDNMDKYINLDEGVKWADVVMMLRIQFERHEEALGIEKSEYLELFGLTKERYSNMKPSAIIMHPAPVNRGIEIDSDLVESDKSRIFKQMENGVYIRKSMLKYIFDEKF